FPGVCPYHGRCLEGVASGPALQARAGRPAQELAPDDPIWDQEARYLAYGLQAITQVLSPQRIVVGGGVASYPGLRAAVRRHLVRIKNGYIASRGLGGGGGVFVGPPALGERSGVLGGFERARRELERSRGEER